MLEDVLCSCYFFVNTSLKFTGTEGERGFKKWLESHSGNCDNEQTPKDYEDLCYKLPFSTDFR